MAKTRLALADTAVPVTDMVGSCKTARGPAADAQAAPLLLPPPWPTGEQLPGDNPPRVATLLTCFSQTFHSLIVLSAVVRNAWRRAQSREVPVNALLLLGRQPCVINL